MDDIKDLTYTQAMGELEGIVRQLQSDNCDIDQLTSLTARAIALLNECRQRLTTTDQELRRVLASLNIEQ